MVHQVAPNATVCQAFVASRANDFLMVPRPWLGMERFHYIVEWADAAKQKQRDLVEATGADKSNVSRWFKGVVPNQRYLKKIAKAVGAPEPAALFVEPSEYKILQQIRQLRGDKPSAA